MEEGRAVNYLIIKKPTDIQQHTSRDIPRSSVQIYVTGRVSYQPTRRRLPHLYRKCEFVKSGRARAVKSLQMSSHEHS